MSGSITGIHLCRLILLICLLTSFSLQLSAQDNVEVTLTTDTVKRKVDIRFNGQFFTSYIYPESLKKPVLWPVLSPAGNMVTRSYPLIEKAGDRVDHPHHIGVWLNHGRVNGLDFWNNSNQISPEKRERYGTIFHTEIKKVLSGRGKGILSTTALWESPDGILLLKELSNFEFSMMDGARIIDRSTTLTAKASEVTFSDSKEGMFAIRVSRELELPSDQQVKLLAQSGEVMEIEHPDNTLVTGNYRSESGIEGGSVWGTRSKWMKLSGTINGETVSLVIIDHPDNIGYPTYWHARGYGLFAANPLGQEAFTNGEQILNFSLKENESVTFSYRLIVAGSNLSDDEIEALATDFAEKQF